MISMSTLGVAASALPWSLADDRFGRPRALKIALAVATALSLLMPLMPSPPLVLIVRLLEGLALGAVPTLAMAYLADQVEPRYTVLASGAFVSGNAIGGLAGRIIAAPIGAALGWRIGVGIVAGLGLVATIVFILTIPKPRVHYRRAGTISDVRAMAWKHLRRPSMLLLFVVGFTLFGGFISVYNYLGFRLEDPPFNLPTGVASLLFLTHLFGTMTARLSGRWALRWGRKSVLAAGLVTMLVGELVTLFNNLVVILIGLGPADPGITGPDHDLAAAVTGDGLGPQLRIDHTHVPDGSVLTRRDAARVSPAEPAPGELLEAPGRPRRHGVHLRPRTGRRR